MDEKFFEFSNQTYTTKVTLGREETERLYRIEQPNSFDEDKDVAEFFQKILQDEFELYCQVLLAYTYNSFIPCILGVRTILESIINKVYFYKKIVPPKYLGEKIRKLVEEKHVSDKQITSFLISEFGNNAAHQLSYYTEKSTKVYANLVIFALFSFIQDNKMLIETSYKKENL
jgi:hypothetical protein